MTSNVPESSETHAADQAGGEVIFSSDGLEPLPVPVQPPSLRTAAASEEDHLLLEGDMSPAQAFEVFSGKVYPIAKTDATGSRPSSKQTAASFETPWQRLSRLKAELQEMEQEMRDNAETDSDNSQLISNLHQQLQQQLEKTQAQWSRRNESLANAMTASTQKLQETPPPPPESAPTIDASIVDQQQLEQRIARLETALGSSTTNSSSSLPLAHRLAQLEQAFSKLDTTQADAWQKRAKTVRQDLEAAAKARTKLMASSSSESSTKAIAALYNTSQQLQGLVEHLPALAQRLQVLSHVHEQTATYAGRLQHAEQMAASLEQQLQAAQDSIQTLQETVVENAQVMQDNLQELK